MALYYPTRRQPRSYVSRQNMFLMVVVCWLGVVLVGALPFILSGFMGPVEAFFNSMAGFTTTGAATVTPEELSQRVASILACLQVDVTSANQSRPSSRPQMCIM
jgi:Trk-type K+ transport system membrane component